MKIRLLKPHYYENKKYNAGDEIDVPDGIGTYLIRLKVAEEVSKLIETASGIAIISKEPLSLDEFNSMHKASENLLNESEPEKVEMKPAKEKVENPMHTPKKRGRPSTKK